MVSRFLSKLTLRRLRVVPLFVLAASALVTSLQGCSGQMDDDGTADRLTDYCTGYGGYDGYGYGCGYGGYNGY